MGLRRWFFLKLRHSPLLFKTARLAFDHFPMALSLFVHATVLFLLTADFSEATKKNDVVSVPMFVVDLNKVKIAEMTNLPPKLKKSDNKKSAQKSSVRTSAYSKAVAGQGSTRGGKVSSSSSGAAVDFNSNKHTDSSDLAALLNSVTSGKKKKNDEPSSNSVKGGTTGEEDPFKTLLASVDGIKSGLGYADAPPADVDVDEVVTDGIEGGSGGSYMQELSVSEKDMIGIRLRECWNLDAGVRGVQNMLVELRVFLNRDGTVKDVKILNKRRYDKETAFRSVAESARRAVYICDKKKDASPFKLFPKNYESAYETWQTLLLRFNPVDGGVL